MRLSAFLLIATLAGCTTPTETLDPASTSPLPTHIAGAAWLPDGGGAERAKTEIAFPVNATGFAIVAKLHLGSRYVLELPRSTADVQVELRAPDGDVLAKSAMRADGKVDDTLTADAPAAGEHALVILSYGGSGGGAGDYVAFDIAANASPEG